MRRIITWRWGHIVVRDEPTFTQLNSDDGFDVEAACPIDYDFRDCWYIWEPVDKQTNRLVMEISDLDQLFDSLKEIGWRLAESHITMCGLLQKTKARRKPKRHPMLNNFFPVIH